MAEGLVDGRVPRSAPADGSRQPGEPSGHVFGQVSAVADAVLYEGYLLYPYRRSSPKNRARWQFGVLFPRDWAEAGGPVSPGVSGSADSWYQQTECLVRVERPGAVLRVRVRYLQMQHKQVEDADGQPVESLTCDDGTVHLTFEEAVPRERDLAVPLAEGAHRFAVGSPSGTDTETLPDSAGRIVRRREESAASTALEIERAGEDLLRLRVRTAHEGRTADPDAPRDHALRHALIATHTLLAAEGAVFVSLIDPGQDRQEAARSCRNDFTFPVLGGAPPAVSPADGSVSALLLSSPIILPDHPQVAPESPGDLHDAGEIDEILTLRTMLLTDQEKREARATDPRAAEILDRVDTMPPEVLGRLHGAIRSLKPAANRPAWWQEGADEGLSPATDTVLVGAVRVGGGSAVRLRPRGRGADAQDMFLAGRSATVAAVFHDVDGSTHLAVTVDDDPAAELHGWYGRFHYFRPDEVEPLGGTDVPDPVTAQEPPAGPTPSEA
ncbi:MULTISPECIES: hypothetical protein [unclassified Streptomyces]|uniref:hypothetical protein n=1 Tax=unclassified Streptomyces TaxID=2593676 RepID=UPI00332E789A